MSEVGLQPQFAALALRVSDVGANFKELVFQFAEALPPFFFLGLREFDVAQQDMMTLLLLTEFGLQMTALLTQHGFRGGTGVVRKLVRRALDAQLDHDPPFVVTELARGTSLAVMQKPVSEARAIAIAGWILDALAEAHKRGIFHGDLHPANIFVEPTAVQISDFGFALEEADETRTATDLLSARAGVGYRAPERIEGRAATAASDVFSVGACLFEMLTGKRPFAASAPVDEVAKILSRPAPRLGGPYADAVARALSRAPSDRFASAEEMRDALRPRSRAPIFIGAFALVLVIAAVTLLFVHPFAPRVTPATTPEPSVAAMPSVYAAPEPIASEAPAASESAAAPAKSAARPVPSRLSVDLLKFGEVHFRSEERLRITQNLTPRLERCARGEERVKRRWEMIVVVESMMTRPTVRSTNIESETLIECFSREVKGTYFSPMEPPRDFGIYFR